MLVHFFPRIIRRKDVLQLIKSNSPTVFKSEKVGITNDLRCISQGKEKCHRKTRVNTQFFDVRQKDQEMK
ncbi:hypothetical protein GCE9029_00342 [Grimontia celer]|uniref:Uncharacterized protein n=1 Tax=Grimontia celer TaxID=1796497 RepID=A0A128EU35_9GAMM|nr:hypothetical protein GCE9029_00342 [Grimontia celer]